MPIEEHGPKRRQNRRKRSEYLVVIDALRQIARSLGEIERLLAEIHDAQGVRQVKRSALIILKK